MYDFITLNHYVQLPVANVAAILGWGVRADDDGDTSIIDKDGESHWALPVLGDDAGTVISIIPGLCTSRGAKQIARTFGDVALSTHHRDRIESILERLGLLTSRTVLVEAQSGDEIWGSVVNSATGMRIAPVDGRIVNTMDQSDARPFRGETILLTAKTYQTISDAVWDDPDAYDLAFEGVIECMPGMLARLLQAKAVGNVHVWGVIDGPLMTSQSVCFQDKPYHVAPEGFIGQFAPPGRSAYCNYIASVKDGHVVITSHAL